MSAEQATTGRFRPDGTTTRAQLPHPLDQLSVFESDLARDAILKARGRNVAIQFRSIALEEPPKKELCQFLELEHAGRLTAHTPRPTRLAKVQYDVVRGNKSHEYIESWVDIAKRVEVEQRVVDKAHHAALTLYAIFCNPIVRAHTDAGNIGMNSGNLQKLVSSRHFIKRLLPNSTFLKASLSPSTLSVSPVVAYFVDYANSGFKVAIWRPRCGRDCPTIYPRSLLCERRYDRKRRLKPLRIPATDNSSIRHIQQEDCSGRQTGYWWKR